MIADVPSILVDRTFRLGENPLWDTQRGLLFWTDIDAGELWRYDPDADKAECFYSGPKVGGFTLQQDGDLALFRVNDIALLDPENPGSVRTIAAFDDPDAREVLGGIIPDGGAVGIDHDLAHARGIKKGGDDPVIKGLAVKGAEVFVWDSFAAVAHGNECCDAWWGVGSGHMPVCSGRVCVGMSLARGSERVRWVG